MRYIPSHLMERVPIHTCKASWRNISFNIGSVRNAWIGSLRIRSALGRMQEVRLSPCRGHVIISIHTSCELSWVGGRARIRERCLEGLKFHVDNGPCFDLTGKRHPVQLVFAPAFEGP
eukprot:scaffold316_cov352-Pavlova_lutheri.AAC.23